MTTDYHPIPRPLRIAQVAPLWMRIPSAAYGGTEMIVHLLTEELVRLGHGVTLFAPGDARTSARLHPVGDRSVTDLMAAGRAYVYDHYANAALADAMRMWGEFDVIHCHLDAARLPQAAVVGARGGRPPVVFTLHNCPTLDDAWALARYPEVPVVAVSRFQASLVPLGRKDLFVVHHGIDVEAYAFGPEPGGYLAYVGRMSPQKGPLDAIRVARSAGMPLVLAGKPQNAEEEDYFAAQVHPRIDGRTVRYVGPVDHRQKVELLRGAAALLFPITGHEAFGLIVIEAMACGTPVVASGIASVPELIDVGVSGYHAPSPDGLAPLIARAAALDRKLVRRVAEERFGHRRMAAEYLRAYEAIRRAAAGAGEEGHP